MNKQERIKQFNHAVDLLLEGKAKGLLPGDGTCNKELELVQKLMQLDSSKQSKIRQPLRQSLQSMIKNTINPESDRKSELSDDELEGISAAGDSWDKGTGPVSPPRRCQ